MKTKALEELLNRPAVRQVTDDRLWERAMKELKAIHYREIFEWLKRHPGASLSFTQKGEILVEDPEDLWWANQKPKLFPTLKHLLVWVLKERANE